MLGPMIVNQYSDHSVCPPVLLSDIKLQSRAIGLTSRAKGPFGSAI